MVSLLLKQLRRLKHEASSVLTPLNISTNPDADAQPIESMSFSDEDNNVNDTKVFTLLGFQSGLINNASEIEVELYAKSAIKVSAVDNGGGKPPIGIEYLHEENDFLFRPLLFSIFRRDHNEKSSKYYLFEVEKINESKKYTCDAIPSNIVKDGFFLPRKPVDIISINGVSLYISHEGEPLCDIEDAFLEVNLDSAEEWVEEYHSSSLDVELRYGVDSDWIRPLKIKALDDNQRLVYALGVLGGEANQSAAVDKFNEIFETNKRINNSRRIIRHDQFGFFESLDEDKKFFKLSSKGMYAYNLIRHLININCLALK